MEKKWKLVLADFLFSLPGSQSFIFSMLLIGKVSRKYSPLGVLGTTYIKKEKVLYLHKTNPVILYTHLRIVFKMNMEKN